VGTVVLTKDEELPSTQVSSTAIIHEVLLKETKFGIAKQFGITIAELEKQNPGIKRNLPVGFKLSIRNSNVVLENTIADKPISENVESTVSNAFVRPASTIELIDQLIKTASDNIGTRYRTGGTSKEGFDCSGLMCTTFGTFDIKLPRSSFEQSSFGTKINIEDAQKGDLIFFRTNGRRQINHVGMVVEVIDGEIKFIHSSVSSGVIISSTKEKYYEKNFTQINRVLQ
jgi:cell wall-associated NlpC family hydrolase